MKGRDKGAFVKRLALLVIVVFALSTTAQNRRISPAEAKDHIGERATICGKVVSVYFAGRSKGQPTFLNLDEPYPRQIFTIVIWGSDRGKFADPESKFKDARVCVTGQITSYRGGPEIVARGSGQIENQSR